MSIEGHNRPSVDETVSAAYRELSNERTPEHLDARILAAARDATRSPYSRSIRWTRPLAWAATIALSLAVLLQMTELPAPNGESLAVPTVPVPEASRLQEPGGAAPTATPQRQDNQRKDADEAALLPVVKEAQSRSASDTVSPAAALTDTTVSERFEEAQDVTVPPAPEQPPRAFAGPEVDLLQEAEALAETRNGNPLEAGQARARSFAAAASLDAATIERCSDESRAAAETWFDCVERLRNAGLDAAADEELEQLLAAFPDFERP
jgi:hypothetical protein